MQVLVDTSVWSLALRRPAKAVSAVRLPAAGEPAQVVWLRDLVADGRAVMLGAIRQELLSGIKAAQQFEALREALSAFEDIELYRADFERAARFFNLCRSKGVQGSSTDYLICAAAAERNLPILTTDGDFARYQKHLPVQLMR